MKNKIIIIFLMSIVLCSFVLSFNNISSFVSNNSNGVIKSKVTGTSIVNSNGNSNFWNYTVNVTVPNGDLTQIENITVDLYKEGQYQNNLVIDQRNITSDYYGIKYTNLTYMFGQFPTDHILTQDQLQNWNSGNDVNATWYGKTLNITNG